MRAISLCVVVAFLAGCSSSATPFGAGQHASPDTYNPGPPPVHAHPSAPPEAPPVDTCVSDVDCSVVVSGASETDPCCDVTYTARPMAGAFLRWAAAWRPAHCGGVTCDPLAFPGAQLGPCGYVARCHAGRCANACGEPVAPVAPLPELPES